MDTGAHERGSEPDVDLTSYVRGARSRQRTRAAADAIWRREVRARIDEAAAALARRFGVTRVVLFGSFARGDARPGSDVDLLVAGLEPARFWEAGVAADAIVGAACVDLVPLESARAGVLERALAEGVALHG